MAWVLQLQLLHGMGVMVMVVAPYVLSWIWTLCHMGIMVMFITPYVAVVVAVIVPRGAAAAVIVTRPQKRKLVEKREKKMYKQANAVHAAMRGMAT
jgi:hypothetical protein